MAPNIDRADTLPIPQPKAYPFVGNLWDIDRNTPLRTFTKLADQYGPIYALQFPGQRRLFVNNVALVRIPEVQYPLQPVEGRHNGCNWLG